TNFPLETFVIHEPGLLLLKPSRCPSSCSATVKKSSCPELMPLDSRLKYQLPQFLSKPMDPPHGPTSVGGDASAPPCLPTTPLTDLGAESLLCDDRIRTSMRKSACYCPILDCQAKEGTRLRSPWRRG